MRNPTLLALVLLLAACSTPPKKPVELTRGDYAYTRHYISWLIEKGMSSDDVTGLSIALVDDQEVVWVQGFGYEDKQANIKASPDTVYHLGSIAKVFTATAAMQLAEQGKLGIDQSLQHYLPEFSIKSRFGDIKGITPRNIMTHQSGLPSNWILGMSQRDPEPFTQVVAAIKDEYVANPPNKVFAYSNLGVTLLGTAIGQVSGEGYANYMDAHLLQPLGMKHSAFIAKIPGKAYSAGKEVEAMPLRDLPSGGLNSNITDMTHFVRMLFAEGKFDGKQIVKADSLREMFKVQNPHAALDFDFKMGLGWMLSGVDVPHAGSIVSHGGSTLNYHTMMVVLPEHKLGVLVFANSASAQSLVAEAAAETLKLALEAKRGIVQQPKPIIAAKEVPITPADIRAYEGYFDTLIGLVKVNGQSGALIAEVVGQKLELLPREGGEFGVRFKLFGFIPLKIDLLEELSLSLQHVDGHDVLALKKDGQFMLIGEKLHPSPFPSYLADYLGSYDVINKHDGPLPQNIRVYREDDMLMGEFTSVEKPGFVFRSAFHPVAQNELMIKGLGSGKGETLHLSMVDGVPHIHFSGFDLKKK